jgi:hypothetical protein
MVAGVERLRHVGPRVTLKGALEDCKGVGLSADFLQATAKAIRGGHIIGGELEDLLIKRNSFGRPDRCALGLSA